MFFGYFTLYLVFPLPWISLLYLLSPLSTLFSVSVLSISARLLLLLIFLLLTSVFLVLLQYRRHLHQYRIGDWVNLRVNAKTVHAVIRYFFTDCSNTMCVCVTELVKVVSHGPPYNIQSFSFSQDNFFVVDCLRGPIHMMKY